MNEKAIPTKEEAENAAIVDEMAEAAWMGHYGERRGYMPDGFLLFQNLPEEQKEEWRAKVRPLISFVMRERAREHQATRAAMRSAHKAAGDALAQTDCSICGQKRDVYVHYPRIPDGWDCYRPGQEQPEMFVCEGCMAGAEPHAWRKGYLEAMREHGEKMGRDAYRKQRVRAGLGQNRLREGPCD